MRLKTESSPGLRGAVTVPGDKSLSHRAILFAALAEGVSEIDNLLVSGVTRPMLDALTILKIPWALEEQQLKVRGRGLQGMGLPEAPIDCGNSATTMRLLAGALAAGGVSAVLDGSEGLRRRPMARIVAPLQQMGVAIQARDGRAPLALEASELPLRALRYTLPVASAQVKSCLLLAGLAAGGPVELTEPGPSRDHTERLLGQMGVKLDLKRPLTVTLHPPQEPLRPLTMSLPGDISAASFLIVAAAVVPGSDVTVREVGLNPTRTGLLDALREMGADIIVTNEGETGGEPMGDVRVRYRPLQGIDVSGPLVVRMIDEFPAFAAAAATAEGVTTVRDAAELRHKESDRIEALCRELSGAGVDIVATEDGFTVRGQSRLRGGAVDPHGDHRLAMALAVTGLVAAEGVTVEEAEIIDESFPTFAATLARLGGLVHEAGPADLGADFGMESYG